MNYLSRRKRQIICCVCLMLSYNLYFIFLLRENHLFYLLYLDALVAVCLSLYGAADYLSYRKTEQKKKELLRLDSLIYQEFGDMEHFDIVRHDVAVLQEQLREQFEQNCDLQDFIAKWCHEVKIPLAAALLMNEKTQDIRQKSEMKEQLERINQQLRSALFGCKLQGSLFDIQIKSVSLYECAKTSIQNNQFFLIHHHFRLEMKVEQIVVYSDKNWIVYVLDQLIANAVKYRREHPCLKLWSERDDTSVKLFVEDHGIGIKDSDLRRVFDKGYTGGGHHNGGYQSTGMGLYMSSKILKRLGHTILVESEEGKYTRFAIGFIPDIT